MGKWHICGIDNDQVKSSWGCCKWELQELIAERGSRKIKTGDNLVERRIEKEKARRDTYDDVGHRVVEVN